MSKAISPGTRVQARAMCLSSGERICSSTEFALAFFDGRHHRFCTRTLADSGEAGSKWASQPVHMTFFETSGSQLLSDLELLKLSRLPNDVTGVVLRDTRLVSVIKSIVKYSKTLESSCDASFNERRSTKIPNDLVPC